VNRAVIPIRADEDGPYGCCHTCTGRGTDDCEDCDDADLYELDEGAEHDEAQLALAA